LSDPEVPAGEPTLAYPDQVETVDARGGRGRAIREARPEAGERQVEEGIKIGRYQLLELVGSGGMGMVWGAWDPELERRVALKLVRFTTEGSGERMLREGQVLAKLSHPNLVPIFDVGTVGDQVYLVMEWIRGVTLREFGSRDAHPRAMLDAYRQAGAGLAAAHRVGVVHRDFKPDNAIRGEDGRVRVLDFGLAHTGDTPSDALHGGTPRYMPPEQARGLAATAASDQFAFCVSLREAFEGAGSVPRWVAVIADRGTAEDPAQRFASMEELLAALDRDPARRRRRAAVAFSALGAAVGAFAIGRALTASSAVEPCTGADVELATSWNPGMRDRVTTHLRSLGPAALMESERVASELDRYATTWSEQNQRACKAHVGHEAATAIHEGRARCLARSRFQLEAAGELMSKVDASGLASALLAVGSLPDSRSCFDDPGAVLPPPALMAERVTAIVPRLERALVRASANLPDAVAETNAIAEQARATGYVPLIARAVLAQGRAKFGQELDASDLFAEAMRLGLRGSDDILAVEAYARWIFARTMLRSRSFEHWDTMVELADRLGPAGRFARALMYSNRGVAHFAADDVVGARKMFETARKAAGDADEVELVSISQNLAQLESDPAEAERSFRHAHDRYAASLGPSHPWTLIALGQMVTVIPGRHEAGGLLEHAFRGVATREPELVWEAAWIADESEDITAAVDLMRSIPADTEPMTTIAGAYVALATHAPDSAARVAALERLSATLDTSKWWNRAYVADALTTLARAKPELWNMVLAFRETVTQVIYSRQLARARRMTAERWASKRPDDAARLANLALTWYRGAPSDQAIVKRLEQIASRSGR